MNYSTATIFLFLLVAQASCGPVTVRRDVDAVNATLKMMLSRINNTLGLLVYEGQLPTACTSSNVSALVGEGQQNLSRHHISSFRCHLQKMQPMFPEKVSGSLVVIAQYAKQVELRCGLTPSTDCSVPSFNEDMKRLEHVRCVLQSMKQRLSSATFDISA